MLDMDPEIRARWTAALRSGDYQQGHSDLRKGDEFCCLGVLCDLAVKAGLPVTVTEPPAVIEIPGPWEYDGAEDYLPESVWRWAGLSSYNPVVRAEGIEGIAGPSQESLALLNDDYGWDFAQIADAIDGGASPKEQASG